MSGPDWNLVAQHLPEGIMVVDPQGLILAVNPALERLTGYSAAELVGRSCALLGCAACGAEGRSEACVLNGRPGPGRVFCQMLTRDGGRLRLAKRARLILDSHGQAHGAVELLEPLARLGCADAFGLGEVPACALAEETEGQGGLLGRSPALLGLLGAIDGLAAWPDPVLIRGEAGSGRQDVARALHRMGPWREGPLYRLDGGEARPEHWAALLTARPGDLLLTQAERLTPTAQDGLCRTLGQGWLPVRVLALAGEELAELAGRGRWREDLYYLLSRQVVEAPPLRRRPEDLPELVAHWLAKLAPGRGLTAESETLALLSAHAWPGNLDELGRVLRAAVARCRGAILLPRHLPSPLRPAPAGRGQLSRLQGPEIIAALRRAGGNQTAAARLLGVSRVTLWKRLKRLGLDPRRAWS